MVLNIDRTPAAKLLGLAGLLTISLLAPTAPVQADPPPHAKAHGWRRKQQSGQSTYRRPQPRVVYVPAEEEDDDDRYDRRYDSRYDSRYERRDDSRYDRRYDSRYHRRYDSQYDRRYDSRYDRRPGTTRRPQESANDRFVNSRPYRRAVREGVSVNTYDIDQDGVSNERDPDVDGDGLRNERDPDDDNDRVPDSQDQHPRNPSRA